MDVQELIPCESAMSLAWAGKGNLDPHSVNPPSIIKNTSTLSELLTQVNRSVNRPKFISTHFSSNQKHQDLKIRAAQRQHV